MEYWEQSNAARVIKGLCGSSVIHFRILFKITALADTVLMLHLGARLCFFITAHTGLVGGVVSCTLIYYSDFRTALYCKWRSEAICCNMQSWRLSSTQLPLSWSPLGLNILSPSTRWRGRWRFAVNVWEEGIWSAAALTSRPVPWSGNDWRRKVCMFLCASVFAWLRRVCSSCACLFCTSWQWRSISFFLRGHLM